MNRCHSLTPLLEALSATRIGWFGLHGPKPFPAGACVAEEVVPTNRIIGLEQGALTYRFEGEKLDFAQGALWLVPAWSSRSWHSRPGCRMVWVEFAELPQVGSLPMVHTSACPWTDLHREMLRERERPFQEMALKLALMRLLREGEWRNTKAPPSAEPALQDIIGRLRLHLDEPDLLHRLPEQTGLSARQLRERFRSTVGMSPGRYLEMLRMQQARYLLLTTGLSVKEVAARTGYDDALYFSRRYRLFWSRSPREHRSENP